MTTSTIEPTEIDTLSASDTPSEATTAPRRSVQIPLPSRRWLGVGVVLVVVAGLVAALVITSLRLHHDTSRLHGDASLAGATASARAAAIGYTEEFASYDYRNLAHDFSLTEAHAVSPFLDQYRKETAQIQPDLVKLKSSSTGKVLSAGVVSATATHAVVDLFLDQTITNSASTQPRVDPQRVEMSLVRVRGQWQIAKVTIP